MKKLKVWQIVLIVLGALAFIGAVIDRYEYRKNPQAYMESVRAKEESIAQKKTEAKEQTNDLWGEIKKEITSPTYTVNSHKLDTSNPYYTYVKGTLTANKDKKMVMIRAEFYDSNDVVLGQSYDYISKIEKGKTYEFSILATCDNKKIAKYKIETE